MKPMLACDYDPKLLKFPVIASPKLDGLRGLVHEGKLLSRSLKPIPNRSVSKALSIKELEGFDGELICGIPTAGDVYRQSTSFFMSEDKTGEDWTFRVFDLHDHPAGYTERLGLLTKRLTALGHPNVCLHGYTTIAHEDGLNGYEANVLAQGYEGLILRDPYGTYKYGRSTTREGKLLKVKRFSDGEARIDGFVEQMFNGNEATTNELGRTQRSSHKTGLVGKNTLGALTVVDLVSGLRFNIGTGLDDTLRAEIWHNRAKYADRIVKYKFFAVGVKELPRHPVFLGFRDARDMS